MARYLESPEHGSIPPDMAADCENCRGTKFVHAKGAGGKTMLASCPTCKGTGKMGAAVERDPDEEAMNAAPTMDEDGNDHTFGSVQGDDETPEPVHAEMGDSGEPHGMGGMRTHGHDLGPHIEHGRAHVFGRGFPHKKGMTTKRMGRHHGMRHHELG